MDTAATTDTERASNMLLKKKTDPIKAPEESNLAIVFLSVFIALIYNEYANKTSIAVVISTCIWHVKKKKKNNEAVAGE